MIKNVSSFSTEINKLMTGRFPYLSSPTGRALSLLSSRNESLMSSPDLSSRCSAALRELIAENRAALLARQLIVDKDWPFHHHAMEDLNSNPLSSNQHHIFPEQSGWDRYNEAEGTNNVTLDLMQAPTSAFELLSMRGKSKEEEECSQLWSSFDGTHVVN